MSAEPTAQRERPLLFALTVCLALLCLPMLGQTSTPSSISKARGDNLTLEISANSQPNRAPVALKWEVVFPVQLMELEGTAPEIGAAAKEAGKSLECSSQRPYRSVCTLSGGKNPIADGTVAIYHFKIRTTALAGTTSLKVEKTEATAADSKKWTLNNTETIVIIH